MEVVRPSESCFGRDELVFDPVMKRDLGGLEEGRDVESKFGGGGFRRK